MLEQYENFANLNVELSTKIEQLEASATTNACTINDEQLVKKNEKLKEKLASSQDAYKNLLVKKIKLLILKPLVQPPPRHLKRKVLSLTCLKRMPLLLVMIYV